PIAPGNSQSPPVSPVCGGNPTVPNILPLLSTPICPLGPPKLSGKFASFVIVEVPWVHFHAVPRSSAPPPGTVPYTSPLLVRITLFVVTAPFESDAPLLPLN